MQPTVGGYKLLSKITEADFDVFDMVNKIRNLCSLSTNLLQVIFSVSKNSFSCNFSA